MGEDFLQGYPRRQAQAGKNNHLHRGNNERVNNKNEKGKKRR
jgi:hypothetical protein